VSPRRICRSPALREHFQSHAYDCIHHHSLWLRTLHYAHSAAHHSRIPLVISPRGMMSGWAYRHHRWRKHLASLLIHPGAFRNAAGWHATSREEAGDIRLLGFPQPICVSPNGVVIPSVDDLAEAREHWHALVPASRNRPVALFYSRFHRKKRLLELIDLWLSAPRGDWLLLIAGIAQEYTTAELSARVASAGAQENIVVVDGTHRPPPYAVASLFVLPSRSENFGLVIAEALAAGIPALVTDATPWREMTTHDCGWCVPWENFPSALDQALALSEQERRDHGSRGREWMMREFTWERSALLLKEFYTSLRHG
jgi:glycosyltransferase involved in cell wall biosynthesis